MKSANEETSEIPSTRFRGLCLHLPRGVLGILHTSQFGSFGKCVKTLLSPLGLESEALLFVAKFSFFALIEGASFRGEIFSNQYFNDVCHSSENDSAIEALCLQLFSGTRFLLAGDCSLGIVKC